MARNMTVNTRVNGPQNDFIADNVGEAAQFERLKAELNVAFSAPDESYSALTADAVIARNSAHKDI